MAWGIWSFPRIDVKNLGEYRVRVRLVDGESVVEIMPLTLPKGKRRWIRGEREPERKQEEIRMPIDPKIIEWMKAKGHSPILTGAGDVDAWALNYGYHNGPGCSICGEMWCVHCVRGPDDIEECSYIDGSVAVPALGEFPALQPPQDPDDDDHTREASPEPPG